VEVIHKLFTFLDGQRAGAIISETWRKSISHEIKLEMMSRWRGFTIIITGKQHLKRLELVYKAYGWGNLQIKNYDRNGKTAIELSNPYHLPFAESELKAAWEIVHDVQPLLHGERKGRDLYLYTVENSTKPKERRPLYMPPGGKGWRKEEAAEGNMEFRACSSCASPIEVSRFTWNSRNGSIYDSAREVYVCLLPVASLHEVFTELEKHYGEEIGGLIMRANRNYTRRLVEGSQIMKDLEDSSFLHSLALKGEAYLVEVEGSAAGGRVVVGNPWNIPFIAGEITGWYEHKLGVECITRWVEDEGRKGLIEVTVSRRGWA
jgi:hypothetical protein